MTNLKQLERLRKIHRLIKLECTGAPLELSKKLHISLRQTYLILEHLKDLEAPLKFNRRTKTYYYEYDFELTINISIQIIAREKLTTIYAGKTFSDYLFSLQGKCSKPTYFSSFKTKLDVAG